MSMTNDLLQWLVNQGVAVLVVVLLVLRLDTRLQAIADRLERLITAQSGATQGGYCHFAPQGSPAPQTADSGGMTRPASE